MIVAGITYLFFLLNMFRGLGSFIFGASFFVGIIVAGLVDRKLLSKARPIRIVAEVALVFVVMMVGVTVAGKLDPSFNSKPQSVTASAPVAPTPAPAVNVTPKPTPTPVVSPAPAPQPTTYSKITVASANVQGNQVVINGTTDLPDGSTLNVNFDIVQAPTDTDIGVSKDVTASAGSFSATLDIPSRPEFAKGPYDVAVMFTPKKQSDNVLAKTGKNGKNLSGALVSKHVDFNTLELDQKENLTITLPQTVTETYPFDSPDMYQYQNDAEYSLAHYALAWKNKDWNTMANYIQPSWKQNVPDAPAQLETRYGLFSIKGFKITNFESHSSWLSTISFDLWFSFGSSPVTQHHVTATVINEQVNNADFNGVNPDSMRGLN
jgi:hypothetical protein